MDNELKNEEQLLEDLIQDKESELEILYEKLNNLRLAKLTSDLSSEESIIKRFEIFSESKTEKKDFCWIQHVYATSKRDLFEYEGVISWDKYQTVDLDCVAECLLDRYYNMIDQNKDTCLDYYKNIECTKQDVLDWMQGLMDMNFGSMKCDW